ncbi:hypothetical protein SUGI_0413660 [Cryptomeria japonica]|nr:hypothetical protein SUGI_0413660 [Cryptomeria japonica]
MIGGHKKGKERAKGRPPARAGDCAKVEAKGRAKQKKKRRFFQISRTEGKEKGRCVQMHGPPRKPVPAVSPEQRCRYTDVSYAATDRRADGL